MININSLIKKIDKYYKVALQEKSIVKRAQDEGNDLYYDLISAAQKLNDPDAVDKLIVIAELYNSALQLGKGYSAVNNDIRLFMNNYSDVIRKKISYDDYGSQTLEDLLNEILEYLRFKAGGSQALQAGDDIETLQELQKVKSQKELEQKAELEEYGPSEQTVEDLDEPIDESEEGPEESAEPDQSEEPVGEPEPELEQPEEKEEEEIHLSPTGEEITWNPLLEGGTEGTRSGYSTKRISIRDVTKRYVNEAKKYIEDVNYVATKSRAKVEKWVKDLLSVLNQLKQAAIEKENIEQKLIPTADPVVREKLDKLILTRNLLVEMQDTLDDPKELNKVNAQLKQLNFTKNKKELESQLYVKNPTVLTQFNAAKDKINKLDKQRNSIKNTIQRYFHEAEVEKLSESLNKVPENEKFLLEQKIALKQALMSRDHKKQKEIGLRRDLINMIENKSKSRLNPNWKGGGTVENITPILQAIEAAKAERIPIEHSRSIWKNKLIELRSSGTLAGEILQLKQDIASIKCDLAKSAKKKFPGQNAFKDKIISAQANYKLNPSLDNKKILDQIEIAYAKAIEDFVLSYPPYVNFLTARDEILSYKAALEDFNSKNWITSEGKVLSEIFNHIDILLRKGEELISKYSQYSLLSAAKRRNMDKPGSLRAIVLLLQNLKEASNEEKF